MTSLLFLLLSLSLCCIRIGALALSLPHFLFMSAKGNRKKKNAHFRGSSLRQERERGVSGQRGNSSGGLRNRRWMSFLLSASLFTDSSSWKSFLCSHSLFFATQIQKKRDRKQQQLKVGRGEVSWNVCLETNDRARQRLPALVPSSFFFPFIEFSLFFDSPAVNHQISFHVKAAVESTRELPQRGGRRGETSSQQESLTSRETAPSSFTATKKKKSGKEKTSERHCCCRKIPA